MILELYQSLAKGVVNRWLQLRERLRAWIGPRNNPLTSDLMTEVSFRENKQ